MIPVVWNESSKQWQKADDKNTNNSWYDYDKQIWANAVTIKDANKRTTYKNATAGTVIDLKDVNLMLVWIPRYSYTLRDQYGYQISGASTPSQATPGAFDIKFIRTSTIETGSGKYTGEIASNYYTPSSFCWGDTCDDENQRSNSGNKELPGIWISKFEITGDINNIESKPNEVSLRNHTNSEFFTAIQTQMNKENGSTNYGFNGNNYDTHMIKNTEWGAMAYLSQSKYGKYGNSKYTGASKEIYINNYSGFKTGCSKGEPGTGTPASSNSSSKCLYTYEKELTGTGASTTGTIYGIYDTSGGAWDRVMGYLSGYLGNSGFVASSMPERKYYNLYTSGTGIKGDATNTEGTNGFYGDYQLFVSSSNPWFHLSGGYGTGVVAGVFSFVNDSGGAYTGAGSRLVLATW